MCSVNMTKPKPEPPITVVAPRDSDRLSSEEIAEVRKDNPGLAVALAAEGLVIRHAEGLAAYTRERLELIAAENELLARAREEARTIEAAARSESERMREAARAEADRIRAEARAAAGEVTAAADRQAQAAREALRDAVNRAHDEAEKVVQRALSEAAALREQAQQAWTQARAGSDALLAQASARNKEAGEAAKTNLAVAAEAVNHSMAMLGVIRTVRESAEKPAEATKSAAEIVGGVFEAALGLLDRTAQTMLQQNPDKGGEVLAGLASMLHSFRGGESAAGNLPEKAADKPAEKPSESPADKPAESATASPAHPGADGVARSAGQATVADAIWLSQNEALGQQAAVQLAQARGIEITEVPLSDVVEAARQLASKGADNATAAA